MTAPGVRQRPPPERQTEPGLAGLALAIVELQALSLVYDYQSTLKPGCYAAYGLRVCSLVGLAVPRGLGVVPALGLFAITRPKALRRLLSEPASLPLGLV